MLLHALKEAARSFSSRRRSATELPLEAEARLNRLHGRAGVDRHLDVLFADFRVGEERFVDLYRRCLQRTGTAVTPFNAFQRFQTRLDLIHYLHATFGVRGARAECGVYRGATALLLCHALRAREPAYRGEDFYLIDSFAGTSASTRHDLIPVRGEDGAVQMQAFFPEARTDTSPELVRGYFSEFPDARICAGWVPAVFATLPERDWAFVHLDLTLYEPTLASLDYFYPRLGAGAALLCDASPFCPGARKAWDEFCSRHDVAYVTLGYGETVLVK
jgi:hypothetical protein